MHQARLGFLPSTGRTHVIGSSPEPDGLAAVVGGPHSGARWQPPAAADERREYPLGFYRWVAEREPFWLWVRVVER
jgi:hypothetical protein